MPNHSTSPISDTVPQDYWQLQNAKARFSEVVRLAGERGPQHVTVNGKEKAVIISAEEYVRLRGRLTGQLLVDLIATSPLQDVEMEHPQTKGLIRDVEL